MRTYKGPITSLPANGIFVFGSNTQGRHGKGAALVAKEKFGAIHGVAIGRQGQSYAIVTKNLTKYVHPSVAKSVIIDQISELYDYAKAYTGLDFYIAYSGSGTNLNGYTPLEMVTMFTDKRLERIPPNIIFEEEFSKLIVQYLT